MFLHRLTRPQREGFMSLAREMVTVDGVSTVGEVTTMLRLAREMDFGAPDEVELLAVDVAAERFDTRASRLLALFELMSFGYSDRSYSAMESGLVGRLAVEWSISSEVLEGVELRVLRHRRFVDEAERYFNER